MNTETIDRSPASSVLRAWRTRLHTVTCPSGQRLRIRIPGIETILEHGDLPDELVEIAILEVTKEGGAAGALAERMPQLSRDDKLKELANYAAFERELVRASIIEVETDDGFEAVALSADDVRGLPEADVEMVAMIAMRLRGTDARGVTVGVEPIDRWTRFHETHGLDPQACEACGTLVDELSTADVGAV